jgi:hypothetical protein
MYNPEFNFSGARMAPETKKEHMEEAEARNFAEKAIFETTLEHAKLCCVDGRYEQSESEAISMAGGAAGLLESALAAANDLERQYNVHISDDRIRDIVFNAVDQKDNFKYHSDEKHDLDGCGHNKRCITRSTEYNVTPEQSQFIKNTLVELQDTGVPPVKLKGEHAEKAVFIELLKNFNPDNKDAKIFGMHHKVELEGQEVQAFIYSATLVEYILEKLAGEIHENLGPAASITKEQILEVLKKEEAHQRGITVKELALDKGLPVYEVTIDESGQVSEFKKIA